jgi:hypothetical protein
MRFEEYFEDNEDEYIDEHAEEYCTEMCYRSDMEEAGFCEEDECLDYECYSECIESFY